MRSRSVQELAGLFPVLLIAGIIAALTLGDGDALPETVADGPDGDEAGPDGGDMLAGLALAVGGGLAAAPAAAPAPTAPTAAPGAARLPQLKHSAEDPGDWIDIEITEAVLERLAEAPGATADDGFVARLDGGEVLEIEVSDALEGDLLVLETELREAAAGGPAARRFALSLYILPAGQAVPAVLPTGREDDLMAAYGLVRIGRLDLGAVRFWPDPGSGEEVILEDTRQAELPGIAANRPVRVAGAVFV